MLFRSVNDCMHHESSVGLFSRHQNDLFVIALNGGLLGKFITLQRDDTALIQHSLVAGMEGALPSVVSGLVSVPVIVLRITPSKKGLNVISVLAPFAVSVVVMLPLTESVLSTLTVRSVMLDPE